MATSKYNEQMFRKKAQQKAEDEKAAKPVSIYVNLANVRAQKEEQPGEQISTDVYTLILYVDYRHGVARSFYLVPPGIRVVHLIIEDNEPGLKKVEFLDNSLHTLHSAETTDSGVLRIEVGSFLNGCCYLRMENGRLICLSIDQWPYFLPPFLNPNGTTNSIR
jgi:hypothetical protein